MISVSPLPGVSIQRSGFIRLQRVGQIVDAGAGRVMFDWGEKMSQKSTVVNSLNRISGAVCRRRARIRFVLASVV